MLPAPVTSLAAPNIQHHETLDSTNAEAMRRVLAGERGPMWIVARRQTGGRGRSGRSWQSLEGNLHASLLVVLPVTAARAAELSLVTGVAAVDALRAATGVAGLRLKWPNDILVGRAKTGGILVESSVAPEGLAVVIGIGINVARHPSGLDRAATHLAAHGSAAGLEDIFTSLAESIAKWLVTWDKGAGFGAVRAAWLDRAGPIGEPLAVNTGEGSFEGVFRGLSSDGALLIAASDGVERRITFGDVTLPA